MGNLLPTLAASQLRPSRPETGYLSPPDGTLTPAGVHLGAARPHPKQKPKAAGLEFHVRWAVEVKFRVQFFDNGPSNQCARGDIDSHFISLFYSFIGWLPVVRRLEFCFVDVFVFVCVGACSSWAFFFAFCTLIDGGDCSNAAHCCCPCFFGLAARQRSAAGAAAAASSGVVTRAARIFLRR